MTFEQRKLGEFYNFKAGTGFPKKLQGEHVGDLPFAKVSDMNSPGNEITLSTAENYISNEQASSLKAYIHKPGSVAFAKIGVALTSNRRRKIKTPIVLDNNMMSAELKSTAIEPLFGYYLLCTLDFNEISSGSALPYLTVGSLKDIDVFVPSKPTQREIVAILGALDDKIEVNRKAAETLEEMARSLYRSWFVDFDPVHAKAAGLAPAHMDAATAALFPDSFGEDSLPEGWECGSLSDLIDFNPKEKLPKGTLAPYLDMKALPTAGMSADAPYDRTFTSGTKFRARDTLLARITPCLENGKTAMVDSLGEAEVGWGSTEFIVMRAKDGIPPSLPYCVARDASFREDAIASMTGSSGRQRADAKTIAAIEAAVPTEEIVVAFGDTTMPMIERIHQIGAENQTLAALRDTLLPRLMSGELRVGEAKEQVEAVV